MKARTNYAPKRFTGYAPIPFAAIADIPRLSSGAACTQLVYVILGLSLGRPVEKNTPFHESTLPTHVSDLADLCGCDERTVQRELGGLVARGVVTMEKSTKGAYLLTPLFRSWASLSSYKPGPVAEPEPDEDETEEPKKAAITRLTEKPVAVRAGNTSRKIKIDCGVSEIYCRTNIDLHFEAVVQDGSLLVSLIGHQEGLAGGQARSNSFKDLTSGTRQTRRVEQQVSHPRAAEVAGLFDPFLAKYGARLLSGDYKFFLQSCQSVADVPNDYLVKRVIDRAARPIKSPGAAAAICADIARDWEAQKRLPAAKRDPKNLTREDIDALIAEERAAKRRRA